MSGAICTAVCDEIGLQTRECPTCGGDRGFLVEHYEWYGWDLTCLCCGEIWQDGEMAERPFAPHWRQDRIDNALARIAAEEKKP